MIVVPQFRLIAGPNGSGKTTFHSTETASVLNPDYVTKKITHFPFIHFLVSLFPKLTNVANYLAVLYVEHAVKVSIKHRQSVSVETVLSSLKYEKHIRRAISQGFFIKCTYVALDVGTTVALDASTTNVNRVQTRKISGGHDVAPEKIISRRLRSFDNLVHIFPLIHELKIYDNSGAIPFLVAEKNNGKLVWLRQDALIDIRQRFLLAGLLTNL
jgi:predicted ABC-type ATPase